MKKATWLLEKIAGYGTLTAVSVGLDDVLWPIAIVVLGPIMGGVAMSILALLINLILFYVYNALKRDIFGFERIHELQESETEGWVRIVSWALKVGTVPAFIVLSYYDPFLAVVFMRKKANHFRMTMRDWYYFSLSMLIGCVGVTVFWTVIIGSIKTAWGKLF